MSELVNSERYSAEVLTVTDKELNPVARIVRINGIEILTEYKLVGTKLKQLDMTFSLYDSNDLKADGRALYGDLLRHYPTAEYVFVNFGSSEREIAKPNRILGGLISFRADKGTNELEKIAENISENFSETLPEERAHFISDILELLKDFYSQSQPIAEAIRKGDMPDTKKIYTSNFSEKLSDRYENFLNYSLKTGKKQESIESKAHFKNQPIKQNQAIQLKNILMPKTEILKNVTAFDKNDFDEEGKVEKELEYKAGKSLVKTSLMLKKPEKSNINNILLFPIDTNIFKPVVMQEPLNKYDGKVFKAICTLIDFYIQNNPDRIKPGLALEIPVTLTDIHHAMGYRTRLSKTEAQNIRNSVLKLTTTIIYYDWSQEREARHIVTQEAVNVWGESVMYSKDALYMLEAEHSNDITPKHSRKGKDGGMMRVEGFIIKAIPPIYTHAKLTGVIANVPVAWFDIKSLDRMTDRRNSLIQGLTERISTAYYYQKNGKDPNRGNYNVIVLDSFFYENGIEIPNKQIRNIVIDDLEIIIQELKEKDLIKSYEWNYKGKESLTVPARIKDKKGLYSLRFYI